MLYNSSVHYVFKLFVFPRTPPPLLPEDYLYFQLISKYLHFRLDQY